MKILSIDCGIKNLAYCVIDYNIENKKYSILKWELVNVCEDGKMDFYSITSTLIRRLHEIFLLENDFEHYDYILIENQPVQKNPTMKSVQIVIYTFFGTCIYQYAYESILKLVSASNKLKVIHKPVINIATTNKYKANKLTAIEYTKHYLQHILKDDINLDKFNNLPKQDDYSDALLQGIQYIEKHLS